jgi:hypothetical protein
LPRPIPRSWQSGPAFIASVRPVNQSKRPMEMRFGPSRSILIAQQPRDAEVCRHHAARLVHAFSQAKRFQVETHRGIGLPGA